MLSLFPWADELTNITFATFQFGYKFIIAFLFVVPAVSVWTFVVPSVEIEYDSFDIKTISSILKISVDAVKKRLERARNMIKESLGDDYEAWWRIN